MRSKKKKNWLGSQMITVMIVPERTRAVYRIGVPFFLVKLGSVLIGLAALLILLLSIDYIHILGRMAENKRLKGENFKLRQDLQLVRNKVESMENTIERVRNFAKKLQLLTEAGAGSEPVTFPIAPPTESRKPASKPSTKGKRSQLFIPQHNDRIDAETTANAETRPATEMSLADRLFQLQESSYRAELSLSKLQTVVIAQSALMAATPSLIPIAGSLSSQFGYRRHPLAGRYRLHAGVDIAADPGTPVRAPADGTVIFSGLKDGYGKVVVIDHGYGMRTLFAHSSRIFVTSGVRVKRGEKIAEVGATGKATGPHLHYEIRKNGNPVNPVPFFNQSRF